MPELIPFDLAHLREFENRDTQATDDLDQGIAFDGGMAFTAIQDGQVLGCAGVASRLPPRVGVAWASFAPTIDQVGALWLTRIVRGVLRDLLMTGQFAQIETAVLAESHRNRRWIEALGFRPERNYTRYTIRGDA